MKVNPGKFPPVVIFSVVADLEKQRVGIALGAVGAAATQSAGLSAVFLHECHIRFGAKSIVSPVIAALSALSTTLLINNFKQTF